MVTFSWFWKPPAALHPAWPNSWSPSALTPRSVCLWLRFPALWSAGNYTCLGGLRAVKKSGPPHISEQGDKIQIPIWSCTDSNGVCEPRVSYSGLPAWTASPELCTIWLAANWTPNRPRYFTELKRTSVNICAWHPEGEILVVRTSQFQSQYS